MGLPTSLHRLRDYPGGHTLQPGHAPYESIAFQFSHHRVNEEGRIAHAGQYLHGERGAFPSFEFLRALKEDLEGDEGTIFRYADHENTYLNIIYSQLQEADPEEVPDRDEFLSWITTVARPTKGNTDAWVAGKRSMVDLLDLVKRYFYHPATGGSNSLKKVLPPIFDDAGDSELEHLISEPKLADGAAAMIAYARMQFSEMGEEERRATEQALLKYCELDTLAMVMLWEYWSKELMAG